jgi:serine/threonine protein kinase
MSFCINPNCPKPLDPANTKNRICCNCGSEILLRGRYRVIKQLGCGGFGKTYEVDDSGKAKVLKVLTENNSKAVELFQKEAKVLSQLNSMGIPKVESDAYFTVLPQNSSVPLHCLVMEKIEGVDLEQWMASHNYQPISQTQAMNWIKQLVEILALVHAHQYFHRDIKPQNIMLRPTGQLVLIDFGAVRQVSTTILMGNSHTRIISQGYSPPEQQNGYSVQQSDFFALGRTFIFLLTGKEPQDNAIYDPLTNELHWRKYAVNISPIFADFINHLISPNASQRPENTRVILRRLHEIENSLNQLYFLRNLINIKLKNSYLLTFCVRAVKSVKTTNKANYKKINFWTFLISLGMGYFAIAVFNQTNNKNLVILEETTPVVSPGFSNSLPVILIPKSQPNAKSQILPIPVNVDTSENLQGEPASGEEIENQKPQAALKDEQYRQEAIEEKRKFQGEVKVGVERQSSIRKEKASRQVQEQMESLIIKKEIQAAISAQQKERAALLKKQRRQAATQAEKAKKSLRRKLRKTTLTNPKKLQLLPKRQITRKKQQNTLNSDNNIIDPIKPWESTYPIPKASDELEQVIREGHQ